jgi:hypothetical protein
MKMKTPATEKNSVPCSSVTGIIHCSMCFLSDKNPYCDVNGLFCVGKRSEIIPDLTTQLFGVQKGSYYVKWDCISLP